MDDTQNPILDADERKSPYCNCIGFEVTSLDQAVARSDFETLKVASLLLSIELHGYIRTVFGGVIRVKE